MTETIENVDRQSKTAFKISTRATKPLFPRNFWLMLVVLAFFPFAYGLVAVNVVGALYGAVMTAAAFAIVWMLTAWRRLVDERNFLASNLIRIFNSKSQVEAAYKVAKQFAREQRAKLEASTNMNTRLLQEVHDLTHGTDAYKSKSRDEALELLQRRCTNLNAELSGRSSPYRSTVLTPEIANAEIKKK